MPKWWPWGRSARQAAPIEPVPAPTGPEPAAWQHAKPIQRAVGDIEPTAHLVGFADSLTTSQDPSFTRPVPLLSTCHDGLPVLNTTPDPVRTDDASAARAPAQRSRNWAPRLPSVQRARVGLGTPVQRTTEPDAAEARVFPVDERGGVDSTRDMIAAPDVDERRPLDAVTVDTATVDVPPGNVAADQPPTAAAAPPEPARPVTVPTASAASVQRSRTDTGSSTSLPVVQTVSSPAAPSRRQPAPGLRRIAAVQRTLNTHSLPKLPTVAGALATPSPREAVEPLAAGESVLPAPVPAESVPPESVTSESVLPEPVTPLSAEPHGDVPSAQPVLQTVRTSDVVVPQSPRPMKPPSHHDAAAPVAPRVAPVQRDVSTASPSASSPAVEPVRTPSLQQFTPAVPVAPGAPTRTSPDGPALSAPTGTTSAPPAAGQRIDASSSSTAQPNIPMAIQRLDASASAQPSLPTAVTIDTASHPERPRSVASQHRLVSPAGATTMYTTAIDGDTASAEANPTESVVTQCVTLPVVDSAGAARPSPARPVVQRAAQNRRLVVLPPLRNDSERPTTTGPTGATESTTMGSSPRPVGLQRMFAAAGTPATPTTPTRVGSARATGTEPAQPPSAETVGSVQYFGFHDSEPDAHHYDAKSNTITFGTAHVQRDAGESASAPAADEAPASVAEAAGPVVAAAPAAANPGTNIDELVNRLYDPLVARLRAELWLDRERAGTLMDLGR